MSPSARQQVALASGATASLWRRGSGSALLYLHSVLPPEDDDAFVSALAAHFDVVAPLAPGYADLAEIDDIDDIHDLVLYYDDLLTALGLGALAVVGHSSGGMLAAELAAHLPDRVSALVLVAPFGMWDPTRPTTDLATIAGTALYRRLAAGDEALVAADAAASERESDADPTARVDRAVALSQAMTAALKYMWPYPDQGLSKRLHRVACETLVIWGAGDAVNPSAYAADFVAALPHARAEILGGGHLLPYAEPERVAKLVAEFVGSPGAPRSS